MQHIASATNTRLKHVRALLQSKKERQAACSFVVEGHKSICELQASDQYKLDSLYVSESALPVEAGLISKVSVGHVFVLPDDLLARLSDVENAQGVLAVATYEHREMVINDKGLFLLADNLSDPGNLGSLIRSAVGAGFDAVLLYKCVDLYNPKTIRSTVGMFAHIDIHVIEEKSVDDLLHKQYDIVAADARGEETVFDADFGQKTVLCVGNEANGISSFIKQRATRFVRIPLDPRCESLNVTAAGSICMFEIARKTP